MQLRFYMFSTLISLEDRLRLKLKVKTGISLCVAIILNAGPPTAIPVYTVLPYCVRVGLFENSLVQHALCEIYDVQVQCKCNFNHSRAG